MPRALCAVSGILIATMWLRETAARSGRFAYGRFIARRYLRLAPMLLVGICSQLLAAHWGGNLLQKAKSVRRGRWDEREPLARTWGAGG